MHKITFTLKQHTPLIHFQYDQPGATLRASEVKPKLDKFILNDLGHGDYSAGINRAKEQGWLIGKGEHPALDYKMKIIDENRSSDTREVEIMPSAIETSVYSGEVRLIITVNTGLKAEIEKYIPIFFAMTSFGKRQSKGFGCFFPDEMTAPKFEKLLLANKEVIYKLDEKLNQSVQRDSFFYKNVIFPKWNEIKSGVNHFWKNPTIYKKSAVFNYLQDKSLRWDKRWIKKKVKQLIDNRELPIPLKQRHYAPIDINGKNSWQDSSNEEYRYGRALLGLAELYEYATENSRVKYQVKVLNDQIKRFKSPVTFKVIDGWVYLIVEKIEKEIFDKPFQFKVQKKRGNRKEGRPILIQEKLYTPKESEFSMVEFLDSCVQDIGFHKIELQK